jgi:myo-inositol 2-dehydrogenase / D-chiro-inositol 1-dehydrogenase
MADLAVGVIGTGGMGTRHAHNIHHHVAGARVVGVYDLDQARAAYVGEELGGARVFSDPHQMIQDKSVEAVVIVSPDPTHAEFVHACLRAQKPVLSEKPLATTVEDAESIIEAEQALGRRLISVGFMRRFDPQHVAVKQAVAAGAVGRPILFKGVHRNPMIPPHVTGAIVVTNSAIHDLDSTRFLLDQEITEVFVRGVRTHESFSSETLDMLLFSMTLTNGCLATIETSVAVEYGYEVVAEIVGERGSVITASPSDAVLRSNKAQAVAVPQSHLDRFQTAFVPEMIDWVRSVQTGQPFAGASAWDGYMATLVGEACIQALQSGAPTQVPTPARPDLYARQRFAGSAHVD